MITFPTLCFSPQTVINTQNFLIAVALRLCSGSRRGGDVKARRWHQNCQRELSAGFLLCGGPPPECALVSKPPPLPLKLFPAGPLISMVAAGLDVANAEPHVKSQRDTSTSPTEGVEGPRGGPALAEDQAGDQVVAEDQMSLAERGAAP